MSLGMRKFLFICLFWLGGMVCMFHAVDQMFAHLINMGVK